VRKNNGYSASLSIKPSNGIVVGKEFTMNEVVKVALGVFSALVAKEIIDTVVEKVSATRKARKARKAEEEEEAPRRAKAKKKAKAKAKGKKGKK
jgi:ectoine hydroxylase-related dioxygenase (phytanoyl-CoA dioxygenase family)